MMSTQTEHAVPGVDELVSVSDSDFDQSGLKEDTPNSGDAAGCGN